MNTFFLFHSDSEVPSDVCCAKTVDWGSSVGIAEREGSNEFNPNGGTTQVQLGGMLYDFHKLMNVSRNTVSTTLNFTDSSSINAGAYTKGLVTGNLMLFRPQSSAKGSAIAQIFMNFVEKYS